MAQETKYLTEKAVLWVRTTFDEAGEPVVAEPIEIDVRWEADRREIIGPNDTPIAVTAVVMVDRNIPEGSMMWLGELADLPAEVTEGIQEVVAYSEVPDVKGREFQRTVMLAKYKGQLPTVT